MTVSFSGTSFVWHGAHSLMKELQPVDTAAGSFLSAIPWFVITYEQVDRVFFQN